MTLEFVGNRRKIDTIIHALQEFRIKALARTGIVAVPLESQIEKERTLL